ncbi:MAG TPA: sodium:solute symporter family protein [Candidatus Binatia bacterium]|nr:sodium:solute symporter family protein [Candidatus Binatia bacterium]
MAAPVALHAIDLAIVVTYLGSMVLVGYLVAGRIRRFSDFFLAGRALTTPLLVCTLVSSYYGLDALFGDAGDAARDGVVVWFAYGRPYTLALLVAALVVARRFEGTGCLTLSDILAARYGRATQVAGGIASFLYALPILAIMGLGGLGQVLFGWPLWVGTVLGSAVSVAYVAMGGFWADVLTDTLQFTIMCVSLAVVLPLVLDGVGGFAGLQQTLPPEVFSPLGSAPPLYTASYALTAVSVLVEPLFYQRIFAARDRRAVQRAFLWGVLFWAAYDWATTVVGLAGAGLMATGVLPADTPRDQVLMRVVPLYLPLGLSGFFLGGVLATAMSTVDSYLLLAAGNLVYDIYRPLRRPDADDRTLIAYTRASLVASAAACVLIGLYFERIKEAWNFMATVLTSTLLVPVGVALLSARPQPPLAGALASWGGLGAVAIFYAVLHVAGTPHAALETRRLAVGEVEILREYALFFALPVSVLGFLVGSILGRRR